MSLKKFLQNVSLAGRQWDDVQFVCVLPFSSGPAHLLCLMGGALYVWQITVPQITAHHRNGPLKGAFYFLWSRGGNNIKATVKHIKWQMKPWTIYKVQYNAVKNGILKNTRILFFHFFLSLFMTRIGSNVLWRREDLSSFTTRHFASFYRQHEVALKNEGNSKWISFYFDQKQQIKYMTN